MKHPLNKTELTGIILLGIIVVGITATSVALRRCSDSASGEIPAQVVVTDTLPLPSATEEVGKTDTAAPKRKGSGRKSVKTGSKTGKRPQQERKDPFSDIIEKE